MELFQDVIRGPYAFLLILQILVVATLLLMMIWLVIQRVKDGAKEIAVTSEKTATQSKTSGATAAPGEPLQEAAVVSEALGGPLLPPNPMPAPTVSTEPVAPAQPSAEVREAHEKELKQLTEEGSVLKDKVRYLESRLMEYEIVQEEISSLSELRVENEKLKEELMKAKSQVSPSPVVQNAPAPVTSETSTSPELETVAKSQIDNILQKLDEITAKP